MDPLETGWAALRAFFSEGRPALERAIEALRQAEDRVRGDNDSSALFLWLHGMATAFRYSRMPEQMEAGLDRARELVNLVALSQGGAAAVPFRTNVEAIYTDLSDVVPAEADEHISHGISYSDRSVRLARASGHDDWRAAAAASRGDLLLRSGLRGSPSKVRSAVSLHEDARRRWPTRDPGGRALAGLGFAEALLGAGKPGRAEAVAAESLAALPGGDRYHEARARLIRARALFLLDSAEALDEHEAAVAAYRSLGCRWELRRAEEALA